VTNYGALACLGTCLNFLEDDGFFLVNDYGLIDTTEVEKKIVSKRYDPTMALGVNFLFLEACTTAKGLRCIAPDNDAKAPIHSRLITRDSAQIADDVLLIVLEVMGTTIFSDRSKMRENMFGQVVRMKRLMLIN
jgi:hypothetical protein